MTSIWKPTMLDATTRRGRERAGEIWTGVPVTGLLVEDLETAKRAGYEPGESTERLIGRDPRLMTAGDLKAMGLEAMSPMEAIRAKCLDCSAGSAHEVRCCVAMACPSWPFRMGKNPWRAPASEAQREASRRNAAKMRGQLPTL
jgi:hypothetical protein